LKTSGATWREIHLGFSMTKSSKATALMNFESENVGLQMIIFIHQQLLATKQIKHNNNISK